MNDPMWDLADLSVEAGFNAAQDEEMLLGYFQSAPSEDSLGRFEVYKAMCDLLWTLWGLIQHVNENPAEDFYAYALNRFHRCRRQMSQPNFQNHVRSIGSETRK